MELLKLNMLLLDKKNMIILHIVLEAFILYSLIWVEKYIHEDLIFNASTSTICGIALYVKIIVFIWHSNVASILQLFCDLFQISDSTD